MRRPRIVLCTCLLAAAGAAPASAQAPLPPDAGGGPGRQLLVRFDPGTGPDARRAVRAEAAVEHRATLPVPGLEVVDVEPGTTAQAAIAELEDAPEVAYAEPDAERSAALVPDDPLFEQQWGLRNTGQLVGDVAGVPGADVDAPAAWDETTGSSAVTVAVVDGGMDAAHPDLAPNLWSNPGETGQAREDNGVDDDGNGLVDDVHGWDWASEDADPDDPGGHGTHVSGTIAARGDDGVGVAGLAWDASLMPLRVLNALGIGFASDLVAAYAYAGQAGAQVVNASLAGTRFSQAEYDAIAAAPDTLFVVAAGNAARDLDATPVYPCAYDLPNVVCVAATDAADRLAEFSSFGATTADLAAPGVDILSTYPDGEWDTLSGTSMATPHVSGAAALAWALRPEATVAEVRAALLAGTDPVPALEGLTVSGGRLDAAGTLAALPAEEPPAEEPPGEEPPVAEPPPVEP